MKLSTCSILLLSFLLAGCKEKLATLEFSSAAVYEGVVVEPASRYSHESQLARAFEKLGIARDSLAITREGKDGAVVHISRRKGALDAGQRKILKDYLIGIIQARQQAGFQMSLTTRIEDLVSTVRPYHVGAVRRAVTFDASPYFEVSALHPQDYKPYLPGEYGQALLCSAQVKLLTPAPVSYASLERIDGAAFDVRGTPNMYGELKVTFPPGTNHRVRVPAFLNVENVDLRRLLHEGSVQVHFYLDPDPPSLINELFAEVSTTRKVGFIFGTVQVPDGRLSMGTYSRVNRECNRKIAALGRPFSFQAGVGLDSLIYVTFWDEA